MTTLSPSRYEESPGFGPHKAGQSTGAVWAIRRLPLRFSYVPLQTMENSTTTGVAWSTQHVSCCLCSCMAWEVTPRLNPWGLVDVILSVGSTVMTVAKGQAPGPCQPHRSSCRPNRGMWWGVRGSNPRPRDYESPALTC